MAKSLPLSSYALIAANLIPLIGVLFFAWDAALVLALFWIENLIIGVFNVIRILSAGVVGKQKEAIFICVFFAFHYGLFCSVHGQLLTELLNYPPVDYTQYFTSTNFGFWQMFLEGAAIVLSFIEKYSTTIWLGVIALVLSRLVSFIENFLLNGDIFTVKVGKLMAEPYRQIIVMHVGLILGAVLLEQLNSPVWLLALIVLLKVGFDFSQHRRRHNNTVDVRVKDL